MVQCELQERRYFYSHEDYFRGGDISLCTKYKRNSSNAVLHGAEKKDSIIMIPVNMRNPSGGTRPKKEVAGNRRVYLYGGPDTHRYFTMLYFSNPCFRVLLAWDEYSSTTHESETFGLLGMRFAKGPGLSMILSCLHHSSRAFSSSLASFFLSHSDLLFLS